jgi:hypothetical protein
MENFFQDNGRKYLLFFYSEPESSDKGATPPQQQQQQQAQSIAYVRAIRSHKTKVQIMESSDITFKGICVFFVRNSTQISITNTNVSNVS